MFQVTYVLQDFFPVQAYLTFIQTVVSVGNRKMLNEQFVDAPRPPRSKNSHKKGLCRSLTRNTGVIYPRQPFQRGGGLTGSTLCAMLNHVFISMLNGES